MATMPIWSASSIDSFTSCPHKYYRLRVIRDVKDLPPSEEILYGRKVHKAFENAVNLGDALPETLTHLQGMADKIRALPGEKLAEHPFFLDADMHPCQKKGAWVQGIADLVVLNGKFCAIIDYKTGKRRPSDQLSLYAAMAFATWPEIERVMTSYVWLKEKAIDRANYDRSSLPEIWSAFLPKVKSMETSFDKDIWEKRPSGLCKKWCPVCDCRYCGI